MLITPQQKQEAPKQRTKQWSALQLADEDSAKEISGQRSKPKKLWQVMLEGDEADFDLED